MKTDELEQLRRLIASQRVLALSVIVEGEPYVGLLPYVVSSDYGSVLIHASRLARHTRGLLPGKSFAVLIHTPDAAESDALQLERVAFQGIVEPLDKEAAEYAEGRALFVQRFPASEQTFVLGDFNLYRLRFASGRYVSGFARAVNVTGRDIELMGARESGRGDYQK